MPRKPKFLPGVDDNCPKCGVHARYVRATARVTFELTKDGLLGKVVGVGATNPDEYEYSCSGGHVWKVSPGEAF